MTAKSAKNPGGRPLGKANLNAVGRMRRDTEKMLDALHKKALTGEPDAVRLALEVSNYFDLIQVVDNGQS